MYIGRRGLIAFSVLLACTASLAAAPPKPAVTQVLVGSGVAASDLVRLQAAVDRGGTIVLRGTFALGDTGSIVITRGVTLTAETRPDGTPGATIVGGQPPIWFEAEARLVVQGIRFEEAIGRAIDIRRTTGALIERCEIVKVRPALDWNGYPVPSSVGVSIQGWTMEEGLDPSRITGEIIVRNNLIEPNPRPGLSPEYDTDYGTGVDYWFSRAHLEVSGNTVHNINTCGIHLFEFEGRTTVLNNVVDMGPVQIPDGWFPYGNGIGTGQINDRQVPFGELLIAGNEVHAPNPAADGILVFDTRPLPHDPTPAVVAGNRVVINSECCGALTVYTGAVGAVFSGNRVEGTMVWAMGVDPSWAEYLPADNLFAGNDLSAASAVYDAYFAAGANHNTVVGTCRTWWDAGDGQPDDRPDHEGGSARRDDDRDDAGPPAVHGRDAREGCRQGGASAALRSGRRPAWWVRGADGAALPAAPFASLGGAGANRTDRFFLVTVAPPGPGSGHRLNRSAANSR